MRKILSVLLALTMVLSTVSFALPSAVTVQDAVNEFISEAYSEENAELSGDEWSNTEKGYKLFVIDFETKNDGTALVSSDYSAITNSRVDATATTKTGGVAVSAVGRTNPNYTVNARVNVKGGSGASLAGTDNKYLTVGTAGDSLIFSQLYVGDGTYVFEFETDTVTYNAIRGSYNAGVTPTATAKDGTWYATSHTAANMTEALSTSCSSYGTDNIRFHFSTTPTMYDNIVVYYQPTGWTSPSTGNEGGEEDEGAADTQSWTHPTYGTKLFNMDFDTNNNGEAVAEAALSGINGGKISSGSEGILVSTVGQINPELSADEASDYRVSLYDGTGDMTYSLESVGDSQGLGFIATGSYKPSLYIGGVYDKAGSYTIVIDYKYDDGGSGVAHNNIQFANPTATYYDGTLSSGSLETVPYTLEYTDSDTYISQRIVFYCNGATDTFTGSEKFIIDNLSVYYYDENIDYTEPEEPSTDVWESTEYGTKLYEVNFDTKLDGTAVSETDLSGIDSGRLDQDLSAGILVSNIGKVNPNIDATYSEDYRISVKDLTYSLGTADGKTFLDIKSTTEKPCIMLGGFNDRDGDYTIVIDYRYLKNTSSYTHDRLYMHTHNQNVDSSLLSNESWATAPYSFSTLDGDVYKTNYMRMVFYSVGNVFTGVEEFQIDKISVYYKARTTATVTVTVKPGENTLAREHAIEVSTSGVSVSDIMSKVVDHGDMILKGISDKAGGSALSGTLTLSSDTTLYALWEETGEVLSEYSVEFEKDESSGIDVYWRNHGTNSEGNGYVRNTDGHGVFTFNAKNEHSAVWDSNISFTSFVSKAAPAGEIKAIMVRMRYRNVPYFDCSCATDVNSHVHEYKTGSTNTYDNKKQMMQFYYLTPDTTKMSESQSLKYNFSVADGDGIENDWFTFYIDVSENADFRDKGISDLRLDFNNDVWDGTVIDIDYIRFIGDKSKAPVTQNTNSIKTTDPLGIRFMASLKKELVESSSSYGWVIAREVSLTAAGLSNSDFSYEAATEKSVAVLRGVNFGEGREEALTFSEDSVNVYFTAMLYNIPSDMYEDKLVARPFAVVDDVTYYGAPLLKSVYDVAKALRDGGFSGCTAAQQTYIQRVIDKVEMA